MIPPACWIVLPSGYKILQPTMPIAASSTIGRAISRAIAGSTSVSSLSGTRISPRAAFKPSFMPPAKPRLRGRSISRTDGYASRTMRGVSSVEPLLTTRTSRLGQSLSKTESRQPRMTSAPLSESTTIEISGGSCIERSASASPGTKAIRRDPAGGTGLASSPPFPCLSSAAGSAPTCAPRLSSRICRNSG
ncbi:MAG: hypothetical protein BWZ10_01983 [candidate division BRC1 bacterium ADurb.BinA364]|nr:MAG: hypothetical protein BWZ10_01983 [candidate division BRC1 bacterium ADurb.BinA364]